MKTLEKTPGAKARSRRKWTDQIANELCGRGVPLRIKYTASDARIRALGVGHRSVSVDAEGWVGFWQDDPVLTEVLTNSFFVSDVPEQREQQLREMVGWLT